MWDLIVSVPDHCLSFYLDTLKTQRFTSTDSFTGLTTCCFGYFATFSSSKRHPTNYLVA